MTVALLPPKWPLTDAKGYITVPWYNYFKACANALQFSTTITTINPAFVLPVHKFVWGTEDFGSVLVQSSAPSSQGPDFITYQNSPSPAVGDQVGGFLTLGNNAVGEITMYALFSGNISQTTNGLERGRADVTTIYDGVLADRAHWVNGMWLGDTAGEDMGENSLNLEALHFSGGDALTDYDVGTFNPTYITTGVNFDSVTYSEERYGKYTKIGQLVTFQLELRTDAITVGSATGTVLIGGLPFNAGTGRCAVSVGFANGFAGEEPISGFVVSGDDTIAIYYRATVDGNVTETAIADMGTGANTNWLIVSGAYIAA
jgi:hypothetical protein